MKIILLAAAASLVAAPALADAVQNAYLLCQVIDNTGVGMLKQKSVRFEGRQWTLQIKSPYSGGNSIAYCDLPQ